MVIPFTNYYMFTLSFVIELLVRGKMGNLINYTYLFLEIDDYFGRN